MFKKLIIRTLERRVLTYFGVFVVNCEHISTPFSVRENPHLGYIYLNKDIIA